MIKFADHRPHFHKSPLCWSMLRLVQKPSLWPTACRVLPDSACKLSFSAWSVLTGFFFVSFFPDSSKHTSQFPFILPKVYLKLPITIKEIAFPMVEWDDWQEGKIRKSTHWTSCPSCPWVTGKRSQSGIIIWILEYWKCGYIFTNFHMKLAMAWIWFNSKLMQKFKPKCYSLRYWFRNIS